MCQRPRQQERYEVQHKDTQIKDLKHHYNCYKVQTLQIYNIGLHVNRLRQTYSSEMIRQGVWEGWVNVCVYSMSVHVYVRL